MGSAALWKTVTPLSEKTDKFLIYLTAESGKTVGFNGNEWKDWGDGTANTDYSHEYADYGYYVIQSKTDGIRAPGRTVSAIIERQDTMDTLSHGGNAGCFEDHDLLTTAIIKSGITEIPWRAFTFCDELVNVVIPDGVVRIGDYVFASCPKITSITLPSSVRYIDDGAFSGCQSLEHINIPSGVTAISDFALSQCAFSSIIIPNTVTYIGVQAMDQNPYLTTINIQHVQTIRPSAFAHDSALTSVYLGVALTDVGYYAFDYCNNLHDIYYTGTKSQWRDIGGSTSWAIQGGYTVHCSDGDIEY